MNKLILIVFICWASAYSHLPVKQREKLCKVDYLSEEMYTKYKECSKAEDEYEGQLQISKKLCQKELASNHTMVTSDEAKKFVVNTCHRKAYYSCIDEKDKNNEAPSWEKIEKCKYEALGLEYNEPTQTTTTSS